MLQKKKTKDDSSLPKEEVTQRILESLWWWIFPFLPFGVIAYQWGTEMAWVWLYFFFFMVAFHKTGSSLVYALLLPSLSLYIYPHVSELGKAGIVFLWLTIGILTLEAIRKWLMASTLLQGLLWIPFVLFLGIGFSSVAEPLDAWIQPWIPQVETYSVLRLLQQPKITFESTQGIPHLPWMVASFPPLSEESIQMFYFFLFFSVFMGLFAWVRKWVRLLSPLLSPLRLQPLKKEHHGEKDMPLPPVYWGAGEDGVSRAVEGILSLPLMGKGVLMLYWVWNVFYFHPPIHLVEWMDETRGLKYFLWFVLSVFPFMWLGMGISSFSSAWKAMKQYKKSHSHKTMS